MNGLGIVPTGDDDGRKFYSLEESAQLIGVKRKTLESWTRTRPTERPDDALPWPPTEIRKIGERRKQRWVRAEWVDAARAKLLDELGACEPSRPQGATDDESKVATFRSPTESTDPRSPAESELRSRLNDLEQQVRLLEEDVRDLLASDAAKSDIIRRHIPVRTLND